MSTSTSDIPKYTDKTFVYLYKPHFNHICVFVAFPLNDQIIPGLNLSAVYKICNIYLKLVRIKLFSLTKKKRRRKILFKKLQQSFSKFLTKLMLTYCYGKVLCKPPKY